jgi:hypothetical protein
MVRNASLLWGLALIVGLPAVAEAQLFPNLAIRRHRVSCDQEAPVYRLYRQQYYGYYPTCWRVFPPGWGCPSPEAPNSATALREIQDQIKRGTVEGTDTNRPDEGANPALPAEGRSPFEMDTPTPAPAPAAEPEVPAALDRPAPAPAPAVNPPAGPANPPGSTSAVIDDDRVDPSALPPLEPSPGLGREARAVAPAPPVTPVPPLGAASDAVVRGPGAPAPTAVLAPQRRSMISGVFDSVRGWIRR